MSGTITSGVKIEQLFVIFSEGQKLNNSILTLSGPKRWETDNFVSFLHIKFIMRS